MVDQDVLKAAVVGAGKFGRYHAAKYAQMASVELIAIVDSSIDAAKSVAAIYGCDAFDCLEQITNKVNLASIATPAVTHREIAIRLLEAGIHIYVEKPIACTLADADAILAAAKEARKLVAVGHQERYILNRLYLDAQETPSAIECHRWNTWTGRATDVHVALDLMIHDVDLALQLAPGLTSVESSGRDPSEHELDAIIKVGNCRAKLSASRKAQKQTRNMRIEYPTGAVFIDFVACKIEDTRPITLKAKFSDLMDGADGVAYDPLGLALSDFVQCVRTGQQPFVSGVDGRRALAVTLDILSPPAARIKPSSSLHTKPKTISLFDLEMSAELLRNDIDARIGQVLNHRQYINGPEVSALENALATYTGAKHCLSCSSGTTALTIALMGENLSANDAIFIPAFTYNATCNAVITAGATPVFVDVDPLTCNMCPHSLRAAISTVQEEGKLRPAMIVAVDLYGAPAAYSELRIIAQQHNMLILADAAQSLGGSQDGTKIGSLADMTATSFYPSKTLGGYGDGGALFTDDFERYKRWTSIRWHGTDDARSESIRVGINGRLDSIQCAILLAKLQIFPDEMRARRKLAVSYRKQLHGKVQYQQASEGHANGLFTVILSNAAQREAARKSLQDAGIATGVYYAKPLHQHAAFKQYVLPGQQMLANAEWLAERVLSLPMTPYLTEEQVEHVCEKLLLAVSVSTDTASASAKL